MIIAISSLLTFNSAYADVVSVAFEKAFYTDEESFVFVGVEDMGNHPVFVLIRDSGGNFVNMVSDPSSDNSGSFSTIGRVVENVFTTAGFYNATAFADTQQESEGIAIILQYDGTKVFEKEDFVLSLKAIPDRTIVENEKLSFTVAVSDPDLEDMIFSLDNNPPSGSSINATSGLFTWTPTTSQGNVIGIPYTFDIVVEKGAQSDSESVIITVKDQCSPPISGDWIISTNCEMNSSEIAPANVFVENNATLTIPNLITLDLDFVNFNLTVESGSSVLIKSGGKIQIHKDLIEVIIIQAQTDLLEYESGDTIFVNGTITGFVPEVHSGLILTYRVLDPADNIATIGVSLPNSNGVFSFNFIVGGIYYKESGEYVIEFFFPEKYGETTIQYTGGIFEPSEPDE